MVTRKTNINLPPYLVAVANKAPYHNVQSNPAPTSASKKAAIMIEISINNIPFYTCRNLSCIKLSIVINSNLLHKFEALLEYEGYIMLRFKADHPELHPIELVWTAVKTNVAQKVNN